MMSAEQPSGRITPLMEQALVFMAEESALTHVVGGKHELVFPFPVVKLQTFKALRRRGLIEVIAHPSHCATAYWLSASGRAMVDEIRNQAAVSASPELARERGEG